MEQIKKHASSFLQDKYKSARLALTDVTEAELLAEEATNGDPCSPDAKTMTKIAEASYEIDDYWRIVDILHRRLDCVDWKQWRHFHKSLILLEFLLTHGPEDFADEFLSETDVIEELGAFQYIDDKGIDWGATMQRKSKEILKLLAGKAALKEARFRALRVSKEIQGFGSSISSPFSPSPSSSSVSEYSSRTSSFGEIEKAPQFSLTKEMLVESYSHGGIRDDDIDDDHEKGSNFPLRNGKVEGILHNWDCPSIQETRSFLEAGEDDQDDQGGDDDDHDEYERSKDGFVGGIFSKITSFTTSSRGNNNGFRSISDVGRVSKKKFNRQFSLWY